MTALELKYELYRQIDNIADSEPLMTRVLNYMRRLGSSATEALTPYTVEELNSRVKASLDDIKAGRMKTNEEVEMLLKEEFEWLR
jgi:predicted transcriptional regulator